MTVPPLNAAENSLMMPEQVKLIYEFGPFRLDPAERLLLRNNELLALTAKVFDLLVLLVQNSGHLIRKKELIERLWLDSFVEESNLTVAIATLRKALGESHGDRYIETVPKLGYRFVATVNTLNSSRANVFPQARRGSDVRNDRPSIAVLPLINASGKAELDYFCDGITESIINALAQLPQLYVMARSTVFHYRGREIYPRDVGHALGVTAVMVGALHQYDDQLVIKAELVEARKGWHLWGEQFYRRPEDILSIQDEIAQKISEKLLISVVEAEKRKLTKHPTESIDAYHAYLKGRYCLNRRSVKFFLKGIKYFNQAIKLSKNYALAYAGIADSYNLLNSYGALPPQKAVIKMRAAAKRALDLNNDLAEAHASLGFIKTMYDWDLPGALTELKLAVELNPNYVTARHWYANCLMMTGRFDDAMREREITQELDPLSQVIQTSIASHLFFARQYEQAVEKCLDVLQLDPYFYVAHALIAAVRSQQQRYQEALSFATESYMISKDSEVLALIGYIQALSGARPEALKVIRKLKALDKTEYVDPTNFAIIQIGLGEYEQAFTSLGRAVNNKSPYMTWLNLDPRMDTVRADPRFSRLIESVWGKL